MGVEYDNLESGFSSTLTFLFTFWAGQAWLTFYWDGWVQKSFQIGGFWNFLFFLKCREIKAKPK